MFGNHVRRLPVWTQLPPPLKGDRTSIIEVFKIRVVLYGHGEIETIGVKPCPMSIIATT